MLLQKKKNSSGKGKGKGALVDQDAIRGTQHAKMKAETEEKLQVLEKTIEAMGDNEHTTEYKKQMEKDAEKLRRSTTDTRSLVFQIQSKQNSTERDKSLEEKLEVARTSLELRKTEQGQRNP